MVTFSILQHLCLFRPNFAIPPYNAVSNLSFLLAQVWKRKQPTILNPMTTVGVPSSILQHLSLSLPNVCYPTAPIIIYVSMILFRHKGGKTESTEW